jgi:uncharacterized protein involved in outer membrane biogenesis
MKKIFLILGIGIVTLIIVEVGPKVTQVSIKVDSVDVSLLTGSAKVMGLVVGNPEGYSTPQAISVGNITVSMDPLSVTSQKIMVHSIHVESPEITFEGGLLNGNNLSKILNNVNSFSKNGASGTNNTSAKPAPKIEVDDFVITGAKVHITISGVVSKDISLPDIHLTDLGKGSDGLTPAELTSAVLTAIIGNTLKAVAGSSGNISQSFNNITSSLGSLLGK